MKKITNILTPIIFFAISNNFSFCQSIDTSKLYSDVEYVLKRANHGFKWRPSQAETTLIYERIIANHLDYNPVFNKLMDKYFSEQNYSLTGRLVGLLIKTEDSTYFDVLGRMLWRIEKEFIPIAELDTLHRFEHRDKREKLRHLQDEILSYLSKNQYKESRIKDFCFLMLENKTNSTLFRPSLRYLAACYSSDVSISDKLKELLIEKKFYDNSSLEAYYHELFEY